MCVCLETWSSGLFTFLDDCSKWSLDSSCEKKKIQVVKLLSDLGPSQSQKLAHEMRLSLTLINSSPTPSTIDVG